MATATDQLSATFAALADPTRRAILARLASGEASVTELAAPFELSLPGVSKHLKVLQRAGLITQGRKAQWRPCRLEPARFKEVAAWTDGYRRFWDESFDRLDEYLQEVTKEKKTMSDIKAGRGATTMAKTEYRIEPGKQEVVVTRVFDAPRDLVFKACTDPNLLARWWGPRRYTTIVDKVEVKPGGMWRFVQKDGAGHEFAFRGVYHEVNAPHRTVQTFEFEGVPGHVLLDTATFEEFDGKTKLTQQSVFQSVEDRDGMVQSGMQEGSTESMDRLAELLAELLKEKNAR